MAAPVYATDLVTINDGSGTFTEPTSATLGTLSNADTDNFIQDVSCCTKSTGASGAPAIAGMGILAGAGQTITTPSAYYAWVFTGAGALIDTYANGGIRLIVGNTSANYKSWYVLGKDTYPYVGWSCIAVDPSLTSDATVGSPTSTLQYFGVNFNCLINISKGNPMGCDALRHGRVLTVTLGEASNYATFPGIAGTSDTVANRWGQFQEISGGYQIQGKLLLGVTAGNLVDFRDENRNIVFAISKKVAATFNAIEIQKATSRVDWTSCNFSALGTVSRGDFTVTDDADVNIIGCSFTDVGLFSFLPNSTITNSTFRRTDKITTGGATLTSCVFDKNRATTAVLASSPANAALVTGSTFTSDGTGYGMEITGTAANMTFTNNTWSGYAVSDGSTGNEAVFVNIVGGSMNMTITGGTTPSIRTAGCVVTVISGAVTAAVNVKTLAGANLQTARVHLKAAAAGPFPSDVTVTITNSAATATVSHTGHAMATNDKVVIKGASHLANNGVFTITRVNNDSYTYTMGSSPGSNPTGTIKSTFVVLDGATDANGNITMSRVFPSAQPVVGWVRYGSSPYYKPAALGGSVSSTLGYSANALMIPDV
jgi:hypothetical protein